MNPDFLQQCLRDTPDLSDVLVLTSGPVAQIRQSLQVAYPPRTSEPANQLPEIQLPEIQLIDDADLEGRRWSLICIVRLSSTGNSEKMAFVRLLAKVRDLHADRVVHVESRCENPSNEDMAGNSQRWTLADSLALGYVQSGLMEASDESLAIFEFDISTYKPAPDWLNSKHWANPERWGEHRW